MAIPSGWSAADWSAYKASIPQSSAWASRLFVTDLNQKVLLEVPTESFQTGQWNLVAEGDVDRTFQGTFYDFGGILAPHFDPGVAPCRMIQVLQGTRVDGTWLWVPTFTGRPHKSEDDGAGSWSIEAQGKDCFHNRGVPANVFRKGAYIVDAIRGYLVGTGETHISIPAQTTITNRLNSDIKFGGASDQMTPLAAMRKAASLAGCQLFWTGAGVATVRKWPQTIAPTFVWEPELVMSEPSFGTDMSTMKNRWTGGGKGSLRADIPAEGVYSPTSLARNGVAWSDIEFGEDNGSLSSTALTQFGRARINELISLSTTVTCEVIPFHAVDPMDTVEVRIPGRTEKVVLRDASIPIAGTTTGALQGPRMSLGFNMKRQRGTAGAGRRSGTSAAPRKKGRR